MMEFVNNAASVSDIIKSFDSHFVEPETDRKDEAMERQMVLIAKWKKIGIQPKHYSSTWDNFKTDTPEKQKAFTTVKTKAWEENLFLTGNNGTGKSHLGSCLAKDGAVYRRLSDIYREVRADFDREQETLEYYGSVRLFVIDEIGRQNFSVFEKNVFFEIVDRRYGNEKPTTLITNMSWKEFQTAYGVAIVDRLRPIKIDFLWESAR
jgi:DNA replication protein DnaC